MPADFVNRFRDAASYIGAHRGRTFVIQFDGELVHEPAFAGFAHDVVLLASLGIGIVLVHGARGQIETRLGAHARAAPVRDGRRVTPEDQAGAVKEAIGAVRHEVEARLSMGLANSPGPAGAVPVISGNFVVARPLGVIDGIDFGLTGTVRRVDAPGIDRQIRAGAIVLISPLGHSPTGESFNLVAEEVATEVAISLRASKLLVVGDPVVDPSTGERIDVLTLDEAAQLLRRLRAASEGDESTVARTVAAARHACLNSVARVHLLDRRMEGALLLELVTRDGVGTMLSAEPYETVRRAAIGDVGGILELIEPLESNGTLVRRSREKLEAEIECFTVAERDGTVVACAALYEYEGTGAAELACLAVHDEYRNAGLGDRLLALAEQQAARAGAGQLFVLSTQATDWFKERGFGAVPIESLPIERRTMYNYERGSKVMVKPIVAKRR